MKHTMKMKYFRFLYGETGQCFLHFGELQDTKEDETYSFLYLRKVERHVEQIKSDRRLFLFPRHVNLVILGSADEETLCTLKELSRDMQIDTLLVGKEMPAGWDEPMSIKETVKLANGVYQTETTGWYFLAKSFADGTVALAHGLSAGVPKGTFEDCVMSVKALRKGALCRKESSPDGYGCALGCALYQDYDVCRFRGSDNKPTFGTGTLLFGGSEDETTCHRLLKETQAQVGEIRFVGLTAGQVRAQMSVLQSMCMGDAAMPEKGIRRYLIGAEDLDGSAAAELFRNGWDQRAVLLKNGEGICCSGLLKYAG